MARRMKAAWWGAGQMGPAGTLVVTTTPGSSCGYLMHMVDRQARVLKEHPLLPTHPCHRSPGSTRCARAKWGACTTL